MRHLHDGGESRERLCRGIWPSEHFMYSCIRQGIILMFLRSSRNTFTLSVAKLSVSVGFAIEVLHGSNVAWREQ